MHPKLKTAVLDPVGAHGGMDHYDVNLCNGLAKAGTDVVLYTEGTTTAPPDAEFRIRSVYRGIYGNAPRAIRGSRYLQGVLSALLSAVKEKRRLCHLHFFHVGILEFTSVLLARAAGRRIVITAHDVESFVKALESTTLSRAAYAMAHVVIAHNSVSRNALITALGVPARRICVIPHGNYLPDLRPLPAREVALRRFGLPGNSEVVLFFGQIKQVKGLDVLIRAIAALAPTRPHLRLLLAGRPWKTGFEQFRTLIEQMGIGDRCVCDLRFIPDQEVPFYYSAADVVALPYIHIYQSGVLLLALSYSKPVVVSDIPGMTEIIRDKHNGFVFESGNDASLAQSLETVLADRNYAEAVGKEGYDYVREHHNWRRIGIMVRRAYEEALH